MNLRLSVNWVFASPQIGLSTYEIIAKWDVPTVWLNPGGALFSNDPTQMGVKAGIYGENVSVRTKRSRLLIGWA